MSHNIFSFIFPSLLNAISVFFASENIDLFTLNTGHGIKVANKSALNKIFL
jgi:hypothetical protein